MVEDPQPAPGDEHPAQAPAAGADRAAAGDSGAAGAGDSGAAGARDSGAAAGVGPAPAGRFDSWRRRSATGAILSGIALGLQQTFDPDPERPAIVATAPEGPSEQDRPLDLYLDPDRPEEAWAVVRPWLLDGGGAGGGSGSGGRSGHGGGEARHRDGRPGD